MANTKNALLQGGVLRTHDRCLLFTLALVKTFGPVGGAIQPAPFTPRP